MRRTAAALAMVLCCASSGFASAEELEEALQITTGDIELLEDECRELFAFREQTDVSEITSTINATEYGLATPDDLVGVFYRSVRQRLFRTGSGFKEEELASAERRAKEGAAYVRMDVRFVTRLSEAHIVAHSASCDFSWPAAFVPLPGAEFLFDARIDGETRLQIVSN